MQYKDLFMVHNSNIEDLGAYRREYAVAHMLPLVYDRSSVLEPTFRAPWKCDDEDLIYAEEVGYRTGSGNIMSLLVHVFRMDREYIPLLTDYEHVSLCGPCRGSNGGCPGFAPRFDMIKERSADTMYVINVVFDMVWSLKYATPNGLHYGYVLQQLAYADRLTDRYVRRMLMHIRHGGIGYVIGLGNCPGCRANDCAVRHGGRCSYPEKRIYSMEATGVDCDELHAMLYNEWLPWYYGGTNMMPQYMIRYCGVLSNTPASEVVSSISNFIVSDKSYVSIKDVPDVAGDYNVIIMEIPSGPHKGSHQYVYERQQV